MTRLHHVQVACPAGAEPRVRAFYGDLLGLVEVAKPARLAVRGGVWFRGEGYELHVGVEDSFAPARKAHPAFVLDESGALDELADRLAAAGYRVSWDENLPGYRRFHTFDGDGNRVEILTPDDPALSV